MKNNDMNNLSIILSSRVRAEIFRVLFGLNPRNIHFSELRRQTGLSDATVKQDVDKLIKLGLVVRVVDGNRVYFAADDHHPLYACIHDLVLKTSGLVDVVAAALENHNIELAFVFGSIARGEEGSKSDLDLMVVGDIGLRKLTSALSDVAETLHREVNPHVMTKAEFIRRIKEKEHFITTVVSAPKIWIIGSDNELAAMGQ